jgi:hypothetical protein
MKKDKIKLIALLGGNGARRGKLCNGRCHVPAAGAAGR